MRRSYNMMLVPINLVCFRPGVLAPKHKYNGLISVVHRGNYKIGKLLPSDSLMRIWIALLHRKHRIKQKNTLLCP